MDDNQPPWSSPQITAHRLICQTVTALRSRRCWGSGQSNRALASPRCRGRLKATGVLVVKLPSRLGCWCEGLAKQFLRTWYSVDTADSFRVIGARVFFLPVQTRVPLKFGGQTVTSVTCARVAVTVADSRGRRGVGWGETPLSVQWAWPTELSYETRHEALKAFTLAVVSRGVEQGCANDGASVHPLWWGAQLLAELPAIRAEFQASRGDEFCLPPLPALVAASPFDVAVHDAYGKLRGEDIYATYDRAHLGCDLATLLEPAADSDVSFVGKTPADYLITDPRAVPRRLPAWHLVGGLDPLTTADLTGDEPDDGEPVTLVDWIDRDGLRCLKIKLRGTDADWDYHRLVRVGQLAIQSGCTWLTADFNCTVTDPAYVTEILDRLAGEHPRIHEMLLYVEQPFPYELEEHPIDVRAVSSRKPLFLDESAHDWRQIQLGRELGWTGVALKTCKTQTGAILSACWARAHGLPLMVQDLTNPMLSQIPHCRLAAHVGTIHGVETNAMQFYPAASVIESRVHPGLYRRRQGEIDLTTLGPTGFGMRVAEIGRDLPSAAGVFGEAVEG